jgi:hypothetical protein
MAKEDFIMKNIKTLLIELEEVIANLERIKNDSSYIEEKAGQIYKNKKYSLSVDEISRIINPYL